MPDLILDSNILVKLIMNEPCSKEARISIADLLKRGCTLHTVDIALPEGLNVIWKHSKLFRDLDPKEMSQATDDFIKIYGGMNIVAAREISKEAMGIALIQNITVYDALYVAAAKKLSGTLYTADQKLCATANQIVEAKLLKPEA